MTQGLSREVEIDPRHAALLCPAAHDGRAGPRNRAADRRVGEWSRTSATG
jgi:hypothetical protein